MAFLFKPNQANKPFTVADMTHSVPNFTELLGALLGSHLKLWFVNATGPEPSVIVPRQLVLLLWGLLQKVRAKGLTVPMSADAAAKRTLDFEAALAAKRTKQ